MAAVASTAVKTMLWGAGRGDQGREGVSGGGEAGALLLLLPAPTRAPNLKPPVQALPGDGTHDGLTRLAAAMRGVSEAPWHTE